MTHIKYLTIKQEIEIINYVLETTKEHDFNYGSSRIVATISKEKLAEFDVEVPVDCVVKFAVFNAGMNQNSIEQHLYEEAINEHLDKYFARIFYCGVFCELMEYIIVDGEWEENFCGDWDSADDYAEENAWLFHESYSDAKNFYFTWKAAAALNPTASGDNMQIGYASDLSLKIYDYGYCEDTTKTNDWITDTELCSEFGQGAIGFIDYLKRLLGILSDCDDAFAGLRQLQQEYEENMPY